MYIRKNNCKIAFDSAQQTVAMDYACMRAMQK